MKAPKISVIVPVYNAEKWLRRCVDSILAQTFTDFELLLIDDGSKDGSGAICDDYAEKDARIRVFHKPNGGVSSARNIGLDNAKGEWIAFSDSDDCVFESWLSNYDVDKFSEYDIIIQGFKSYDRIDVSDTSCTQLHGFDYDGDVSGLLEQLTGRSMLGYMWHKIFRKSIIDYAELRFDESMQCFEDEKFFIEYVCHCHKALSVNLIGYMYWAPNWDTKYAGKMCNRSFGSDMFEYLANIDNIPKTKSKYFCQYAADFYYMFINSNFEARRRMCKKYRHMLQLDYHASPMLPILKVCVFWDPTAFVSSIVLSCYLRLYRCF